MDEAERTLARVVGAVRKAQQSLSQASTQTPVNDELSKEAEAAYEEFLAAMSDDFNTALASGVLFTLVKKLNIYLAQEEHHREVLEKVLRVLQNMTEVLGILPQIWEPESVSDEAYHT